MKTNIAILGSSTDVGKTICSSIVVEALQADYWKPIQCGELEYTDSMKVQDLISNTTTKIHPEAYALKAPQSPHYAAQLEQKNITISTNMFPKTQNSLVIETAGGICVPLNQKDFILDFISKETPLILVSKHKLGSINHSLLSLFYLKTLGYKKTSILFSGNPKPSTEKIIIHKYPVYNLGNIPWVEEINSKFVQDQAQKIKNNLLQFLFS